jgi:hypothetical protein
VVALARSSLKGNVVLELILVPLGHDDRLL